MDEEQLFENTAAEQGWSAETQVGVLLEYVKNQQSPEAFADFLAEQQAYMQEAGPSS